MRKLLALTSTLLTLAACSKSSSTSPSQQTFPAQKLAPASVSDTFKAKSDGNAITGTNGSSITIRKSSLGKAFLMTMTVSDSETNVSPNALLPKVVTFELNGTEVGLLEQSIYSIYDEIPSSKVLQSFPVESQDADTVTFKWAYGLSSIPMKPFYVSADNPGTITDETAAAETVSPVTASYLKFARIQNNRLEIRQVARIRDVNTKKPGADGSSDVVTKDESVQLDIGIAPYVPNPRFHPKLSVKLKGMGFFDIANVRRGDGAVDLYSSRWDLSPEAGPITYAISKTAPAEAVEAMKEGLQYWNNVSQATLGRDIIKIETGADPAAPLKPRTVIVYWVPDATAGAAFANFSPDPLTGEITQGFVYQASVFFSGGRNRGRRFVDRGDETNQTQIVATGFLPARICDISDPPLLGLDPMAGGIDMDEKIGEKMGLDYLRFVVAHETGHTLGLRHNFAGSLGSEVATPLDARDLFAKYLSDPGSQGAATSDTVMDYTTFRDTVMQGAAIGAKRIFPYDKAAITWAYGDKDVTPADLNTPPYCADTEGSALKTLGCAVYDTGPHPVTGHAWEAARNRLLAPDIVIEALTDAIRPDNPNDQLTVKEALAASTPDSLTNTLSGELPNVMRIGGPGMKAIQVDRSEEGLNWSNKADYLAQTKSFIGKEFELAGGLPGILKTAYNLDDDFHAQRGWLVAAIHQKVNKPTFGQGKTNGGKPYQLTAAELRDVKAAADKLGAATESALLRDLFLAVTGLVPADVNGKGKQAGKLTDYMAYTDKLLVYDPDVVQDSWQAGLDALASQVATDVSDTPVKGTIDGKDVSVNAARFTTEDRVAAMRLYSPKVFARDGGSWMNEQSAALAKTLLDHLSVVETLDGGDPGKAMYVSNNISPELRAWAEHELAVYRALWAARH